MTAALTAPASLLLRSRGTAPPSVRAWRWGLVAVALVALVLTGWQVWAGAPSEYYASIALSMSTSWTNFFFGSVDPAGTVTLDKIPGSFWIPALFIRAFGYSAWTVILPNALAATGAALIVAVTARRLAGVAAGLVAGAVVATTPILVAVARSNQPETFFVLGLSLTAWASVRAVQGRSLGWLLAAAAFVGLSFQFYMLEAWAVWPALIAAYLCTAQPWVRKIGHLALAGVVGLVSSLWWVAIVSLIPAGSRPYIGSTLGNDPWEMVFGYNGLGRFSATSDSSAYESFTPPFSGDPGVLRLFNAQLAGQIAWLVPAAVVGLIVLWLLRFPRAVTVLLTVWLLTFAAMFSTVAGMHQFYTAALAVPLGLVVATALVVARRQGRTGLQIAVVGVAALTALGIGIATGGYSVPVSIAQAVAAAVAIALLLSRFRARAFTAAIMLVGLLLTPAAWSVVTIAHPSSINPVAGGASEMTGGGFGGRGGQAPGGAGGPQGGGAPGATGQGFGTSQGAQDGSGRTRGMAMGAPGQNGGGGIGGRGEDSTALLSWLKSQGGGSTYLAATFGAQSAAQLIVASDGASILPIGGFNGTDAVPTLDTFISLVQSGQLKYVIGSSQGGFGGAGQTAGAGSTGQAGTAGPTGQTGGTGRSGGFGGRSEASTNSTSSQIRTWVEQNCTTATGAPTTVYVCGPSS